MTSPAMLALSDAEYRQRTHAILSAVESQLDAWLDDDTIDIDTHRSGGLLELSFPNGSKIVLNTQPPLQELWMAARAGGFHFRWAGDAWRDTKDGVEFHARLSEMSSQQAGRALVFQQPA
jgi:CyaY protein